MHNVFLAWLPIPLPWGLNEDSCPFMSALDFLVLGALPPSLHGFPATDSSASQWVSKCSEFRL